MSKQTRDDRDLYAVEPHTITPVVGFYNVVERILATHLIAKNV